jgi:hypothetical protein
MVGGINSSMPVTSAYDPLMDIPSYCNLKSLNTNFADLVQTANYFDQSHPKYFPDPSPNMTDALAEQGAVILPFSYFVASFSSGPGCHSLFTVNAYPDTAPGDVPPDLEAKILDAEVQSVKCLWPNAAITIIGHSNGGLVVEQYWQNELPKHPANVKGVYSLDGVINGVADPTPFYNISPPTKLNGKISDWLRSWKLSTRTVTMYYSRWRNRAAIDKAIIAANGAGIFTPIGTENDSVYDIPDCYAQLLCYDGIFSQLLFDSFPGPGQPGTLVSTDILTPGSAPPFNTVVTSDWFVPHAWVMESQSNISIISNAVQASSTAPARAQAAATVMTTGVSGSLSSTTATVGQTVTITGHGLGATRGTVQFWTGSGYASGSIVGWGPTAAGFDAVQVTVPSSATTGEVYLTTSAGVTVPVGGLTILGVPNGVTALAVNTPSAAPIDGQTAAIQVTALNKKTPVAGVAVTLSDGQGTSTLTTDSRGSATFSYAGVDQRDLVVYSGSASNAFHIAFQLPPAVSLALSASLSSAVVSQTVTISATVTNASGAPLANQSVTFGLMGSASASQSATTAQTNAAGLASITVSSTTPGITLVTAATNFDFAWKGTAVTWNAP